MRLATHLSFVIPVCRVSGKAGTHNRHTGEFSHSFVRAQSRTRKCSWVPDSVAPRRFRDDKWRSKRGASP